MSRAAASGPVAEAVMLAAAEYDVPGGAVAVLRRDNVEEREVFGVTSLEHPLPVDERTLFQIGSITKTFTAIAAYRLALDGQLALDAPVRSYLPQLRLADEAVARAVTPRHLLTHSAGWEGDFFIETGSGEDALAKLVERMPELSQVTPLGSEFSYNNAAYSLLGRVLEVVAGKSYEDVVEELVLEPLGLELTGYGAAHAITHSPAIGHVRSDGRTVVARPWAVPRASHPVGGLVSNLEEMQVYARFALGAVSRGNPPLPPSQVADMQRPQRGAGSIAEQVGLSWMIERRAGVRIVSHTGGMNGQVSGLYLAPDARVALVILTNGEWGNQVLVSGRRAWLEHYLGCEDEPSVTSDVAIESLQEYVGEYESKNWIWTVAQVNGALRIQPIPNEEWLENLDPAPEPEAAARLAFTAPDAVTVVEPGRTYGMSGEFGRDAAGRIAWLRFDGRISPRR